MKHSKKVREDDSCPVVMLFKKDSEEEKSKPGRILYYSYC